MAAIDTYISFILIVSYVLLVVVSLQRPYFFSVYDVTYCTPVFSIRFIVVERSIV